MNISIKASKIFKTLNVTLVEPLAAPEKFPNKTERFAWHFDAILKQLLKEFCLIHYQPRLLFFVKQVIY